jgi:serine/threonine-protein kinase
VGHPRHVDHWRSPSRPAGDEDTERTARLSPNGRWLAYESNRSGRDEIWVAPYPPDGGAPVRVSRDGGKQPVWSHNGRELYYLQSNRLMAAAVETSKRNSHSSGPSSSSRSR